LEGALLVGTKVNGLPILGVITLVLTIHYIYKTIKNKGKFITIEKGNLIRNICVIGILLVLAIIVAFPSYYYSKKVYDNYLYYTTVKNEELVAYCLELKGYVEKYSKDSDYSSYIIETLKLILD
jgi:hypothetical protein